MSKAKTVDLTSGPILKTLAELALPIMISSMLGTAYSIMDMAWIGLLGAKAVAGVGVGGMYVWLSQGLASLSRMGGQVNTAQACGRKDYDQARSYAASSLQLTALSGILFAAVCVIFIQPLLGFFNLTDAETYTAARSYTLITCGLILFSYLNLTLTGLSTAQGDSRTPFVANFAGMAANIVLDPLFIFAFHLGVRGAALATILSQAVSCIWVLSFLCGKKTILHIRKKNLILKPEIILPCVALGLATFIMQASESIISVCFNSSLLKYGGDIAVGAMTILTSVMQFAMLPLQGLGQGAQPVLSYNYGAKNRDRVKKAFRLLLTASLCYSTILWAFIMLFPQVFAEMFTSDSALLGFTKSALRIYCACLLLFGIQIACQMAFTSFGKAKASIAVAVTRKFILLLPLIYLLPHILTGNKTNAVYMAEPIADFLAVSFTTVLFTFQFRKVLKELEG